MVTKTKMNNFFKKKVKLGNQPRVSTMSKLSELSGEYLQVIKIITYQRYVGIEVDNNMRRLTQTWRIRVH